MSWVDIAKQWRVTLSQQLAPQPVVFHHVPKCGGTSVGRALRLRYLLSQATIDTEATFNMAEALLPEGSFSQRWDHAMRFRESTLIYLMMTNVRCISAHVAFSETAHAKFSDQYAFVTILRDPVERFISHYFHSRRPGGYFHTDMSLLAFLNTEAAPHLGQRYVEYFGDPLHLLADDTSARIKQAKINLDKFSTVGFLDDMKLFCDELHHTLGIRLRIGHENRRLAEQRGINISGDELRQVEKICAPDIEIYQYAKQRFITAKVQGT